MTGISKMFGLKTSTAAALMLATAIPSAAQELPFTVRVFDDARTEQDIQIAPGVSQPAQLDMRYAAEAPEPRLSGLAWQTPGEVQFSGWSNYGLFVKRAEFRVLQGADTVAVVPTQLGSRVAWAGTLPEGAQVILRVYGARGRYDETAPIPTLNGSPAPGEILTVSASNALDRRAIRLNGRAVVADGAGVKPGQLVLFAGQAVPVRADGRFEDAQIVPAGAQTLELLVTDHEGRVMTAYRQPVQVADEDSFHVGIVDLTVGQNNVSGPIATVTGDSSERFNGGFYQNGRLAFYMRDHTRGGWKITTAADTGEGPVEDLFDNFLARDPYSFLRRLDPRTFYPVYGDDSTAINDAPTDGKFFLRAEREGVDLLWGSFKTTTPNTHFTNFSRSLYGARISGETARDADGSPRLTGEIFAAQPGTSQAQEEFRGIGGSIYFLRNRDILRGSEKVWVETRDATTGALISRRDLLAGSDYEVNAIQGRLQLTSPLASSVTGNGLLNGSTGGNPQYLVVGYEHTPTANAPDDVVAGGTLNYRASERLSFGVNGISQQDGADDQTLGGLTASYKIGNASSIDLEYARSLDGGITAYRSLDGGFTFASVPGGSAGSSAGAARVGLSLDLAELGLGQGHADLSWQKREAGFSGPGAQTDETVTQFSADIAAVTSPRSDLRFVVESSDAASQTHNTAEVNFGYQISDPWKLSFGLKNDDLITRTANASNTLSANGTRLDGVLRADYESGAGWTAFGYGQGTLDVTGNRAENNRIGFGGSYRVSEQIIFDGELSTGTGGLGAEIGATWQVDDRTQTYLSYALTPDGADNAVRGQAGTFTYGGSRRVADNIYVLAEQTYLHGSGPSGVTNSFGLDYTPDNSWVFGAQLEIGQLADPLTGDLERRAASVSASYSREKISYRGVLEYRVDTDTDTRTTMAVTNNLGYQVSDNWRFLGELSALSSTSSASAVPDGEFVELISGVAYRPVENDRLNALFRYTYIYDNGQNGSTATLAQRSNVLSADAIYQVSEKLALGGKIGLRYGDVRLGTGTWTSSDALLGVIRADLKLRPKWDLLGEYRILSESASGTARTGAVTGLYRHINENLRVGLGYSAVDFSDDLTNQDYSSDGLFLNFIGKF